MPPAPAPFVPQEEETEALIWDLRVRKAWHRALYIQKVGKGQSPYDEAFTPQIEQGLLNTKETQHKGASSPAVSSCQKKTTGDGGGLQSEEETGGPGKDEEKGGPGKDEETGGPGKDEETENALLETVYGRKTAEALRHPEGSITHEWRVIQTSRIFPLMLLMMMVMMMMMMMMMMLINW